VVNSDLHFDYTTIGHVTIDVLEDGSRRPGGTAFYSALQASRLGRRALILTRGVPEEIEAALGAYRDELELHVQPAEHTTTLRTDGIGSARTQRVLAWAGPIEPRLTVETSILHLAPVARECAAGWAGSAGFVGLTPQGLARDWSGPDATMTLATPDARVGDALAGCCDAVVVNRQEREFCAALIAAASGAGATVAITAGRRPSTILAADRSALELEVPPLERPADDLGAGDVFAAAFFIALADRRSPGDSANFANAAAAVRMQGVGADAIGRVAEIEARLRAAAAAELGSALRPGSGLGRGRD
jgi:1D-myo-inositol 3-kinase